jgi:hypothetical protein
MKTLSPSGAELLLFGSGHPALGWPNPSSCQWLALACSSRCSAFVCFAAAWRCVVRSFLAAAVAAFAAKLFRWPLAFSVAVSVATDISSSRLAELLKLERELLLSPLLLLLLVVLLLLALLALAAACREVVVAVAGAAGAVAAGAAA